MMDNVRENFVNWLKERLKNTSCQSYINGLDNLGRFLDREIDIYSIVDTNMLNSIDAELTERLQAETDKLQKDYWNDRRSFLRKYIEFTESKNTKISKEKEEIMNRIEKESNLPRNKIHFGAPGVGKSYGMNGLANKYFEGRCERVTFYSDYGYAQFVGTYKPTVVNAMKEKLDVVNNKVIDYVLKINAKESIPENYLDTMKSLGVTQSTAALALLGVRFSNEKASDILPIIGKNGQNDVEYNAGRNISDYVEFKNFELDQANLSDITYAFTPGPFTEVLVKSLNNPNSNHLLIIEEINRADAAGVFGDVFQLLDRHHNGESEYGITPAKIYPNILTKKYQTGEISGMGNSKYLPICSSGQP